MNNLLLIFIAAAIIFIFSMVLCAFFAVSSVFLHILIRIAMIVLLIAAICYIGKGMIS